MFTTERQHSRQRHFSCHQSSDRATPFLCKSPHPVGYGLRRRVESQKVYALSLSLSYPALFSLMCAARAASMLIDINQSCTSTKRSHEHEHFRPLRARARAFLKKVHKHEHEHFSKKCTSPTSTSGSCNSATSYTFDGRLKK